MIIVNWNSFTGNPQAEQTRCYFVAMTIIMIVMIMLMGGGAGGSADLAGHGGGILFGLFFGFAFFPRVESPGGKKFRIAGMTLCIGLFVLMTGLLFGTHQR